MVGNSSFFFFPPQVGSCNPFYAVTVGRSFFNSICYRFHVAVYLFQPCDYGVEFQITQKTLLLVGSCKVRQDVSSDGVAIYHVSTLDTQAKHTFIPTDGPVMSFVIRQVSKALRV